MEIEIAQRKHKKLIVELIANAFAIDPQIVYYTNGNRSKIELIAKLAFETCMIAKGIYITDDLNAVAICYPSTQNNFSFRVLWENLKFPFVFGLKSLSTMMNVEKMVIAKRQKPEKGLYLWLLAADPAHKGKGHGTALLNYLDNMANFKEIILETSNNENLGYYQKRGYKLYDELRVNEDLNISFFKKSLL
jgi:ribosomal protein S18 acetylase RimI-like enzyme